MPRLEMLQPEKWLRDKDAWTLGCTLYVVEEQHPGPIKVGVAEHPIRRLSSLQCGNPRQLHLRAIYTGLRSNCLWVESAILFRFSGSLLRGEWLAERLSDVLREIDELSRGEVGR